VALKPGHTRDAGITERGNQRDPVFSRPSAGPAKRKVNCHGDPRHRNPQRAAGHGDPGTTKLHDRRDYNPKKAASFFATY
jgi:hypothetical protein